MKEFRGTKGEWLVDDIDVISRETGFAFAKFMMDWIPIFPKWIWK